MENPLVLKIYTEIDAVSSRKINSPVFYNLLIKFDDCQWLYGKLYKMQRTDKYLLIRSEEFFVNLSSQKELNKEGADSFAH